MIKKLKESGPPVILASERGKSLIRQTFFTDNSSEDFVLFDSDKISATIFPLTSDNEVLAVRQFRAGAKRVITELPGGNVDIGRETPVQAIVRELLEETGYRVGKVIGLKPRRVWFEPTSFACFYFPFAALACRYKGKAILDQDEHLELVKTPLKVWLSMINRGEIDDNKTIAITFLAVIQLGLKRYL